MTFALDLSNYTTDAPVPNGGATGGLITRDLVECWKSQGFTHAIVGTQWPVVARHQLEVCGANGMTLDAYHWLWFDRDYKAALQQSIETVRDYPIRRLWIDIEDSVTTKTAEQMIPIAHEVMAAAKQLSGGAFDAGIYTARWWWPARMRNYEGLSQYPLWHAHYHQPREGEAPTHIPTPGDFDSFESYGGWKRPAMWQYAGSVKFICGSNLDLNVTFESLSKEAGEVFVPYVANADWFEKRRWEAPTPLNQMWQMQALTDFELPPAAAGKDVVFAVYMDAGRVRFYHGGSQTEAGVAGERGVMYQHVRARLNAAGEINFRAEDAPTSIARIQCLGYFR